MKILKRNNNTIPTLTLLALAMSVIAFSASQADAQTRKIGSRATPKKASRPPENETASTEKVGKASAGSDKTVPVALINSPEPDFLSGEASVVVNPKQPTVIRLGLAQNAVSIVEFPASDGIYYIHEGNPKLASVFQSPTRESDRSITIYPGEGLVPSKDGSTAAAISLQMRSGLVLILELVPVNDLKRNAHRCVVTYDRDAVVSARKIAGLAFNLGGDTVAGAPINSRAVSKLVGAVESIDVQSLEADKQKSVDTLNTVFTDISDAKKSGSKRTVTDAEISRASNKRLAEVLRDQKKHLGDWTKPLHGLELAVSRTTELDSENRLVVVAIRNTTTLNLRLVEGFPLLQIQTLDKDGNSLLTSKIELRYLETTSSEGVVLPGSNAYFALVFKSPTLGANQKIRVAIAHKDAADAPVSAALTGSK